MTDPDAYLLRLCAEFQRQHATVLVYDRIATHGDDDDFDELALVMDARWDTSDKIQSIHASTHAGLQAQAGVFMALSAEQHPHGVQDADLRFAQAILSSITQGAVA